VHALFAKCRRHISAWSIGCDIFAELGKGRGDDLLILKTLFTGACFIKITEFCAYE
jgi:hypothetical protein